MSKIALFAEFEIAAAQRQAFVPEINDHAAKTLAGEEGCLAFQVYADQAALDVHRDNPQRHKFRAATGDMVTSRRTVEGLALPTA